MTILLINTSQPQATVALAQGDRILGQRTWQATPQAGQQLLVAIDQLLDAHHLALSDLDRIAVHPGPGHYSAVRQGIVTATMLAYTVEAELVAAAGRDLTEQHALAAQATPLQVVTPVYSAKLS